MSSAVCGDTTENATPMVSCLKSIVEVNGKHAEILYVRDTKWVCEDSYLTAVMHSRLFGQYYCKGTMRGGLREG